MGEMKLEQHKRSGLWYRPDTTDLNIIREQGSYRLLGIEEKDRVLDIGGHIGAFAVMAAKLGAVVLSYEPDPTNFGLYRMNTAAYSQHCTGRMEAIGHEGGKRSFYLNNKKDAASHTLLPKRGRDRIEVYCVPLSAALAWFATVLKIDIEGGEYELAEDLASLPPEVRTVAIELHFPARHPESEKLIANMAVNYEVLREAKYNENSWNTLGIWRRRR